MGRAAGLPAVEAFITDYLVYFPLASIAIYIFFVLIGRGRLRTSLFLSLSLPGTILLPLFFFVWGRDDLAATLFILPNVVAVALPAAWIFPVVCSFKFAIL